MIAVPAVIVVALVLALTAGGSSEPESAATPPATAAVERADRFDSARAWKHVRHKVALGPRPAGSPQLAKLAGYLRKRLPRGHYEAVAGHPGLRNVVGRIPGAKPAVVLAAHYDTKNLPGFVGANDGAGGTAAVLEIARALRKAKRPKGAPEIRFAFFDGEEATDDTRPFEATALRGSKDYAKRHGKEIRALVLLDFVAEKGAMRIPREAGSDAKLWARLRAAAKRAGSAAAFPPGVVGEITDDHTPFTQRGIPAIDLIDFTFDCWHEACDDLSAVSERSLDLSGEAVLEMLRAWR
jgi:glutaminyl-peptide cyclotransferase